MKRVSKNYVMPADLFDISYLGGWDEFERRYIHQKESGIRCLRVFNAYFHGVMITFINGKKLSA